MIILYIRAASLPLVTVSSVFAHEEEVEEEVEVWVIEAGGGGASEAI